ncbi:MAG TPA: tetratricopeptide repeat protein [Chloroflexia bacterium]|nr:tetratricopeptide repeat protein [Chloroflexia bacterium]
MAGNGAVLEDFDALWDYNDPVGTGEKFRALLPAAEAAGDATYRAELLTQVARAEGLSRRFEEAHRTLDEVERELASLPPRATVRYLLERGRVFNSSGDKGKARPLFLEALDLARHSGEDFYAVDAAHMLGIIDPPDKQLDWHLLALQMAERSTEARARGWQGSLYNNLGWTYHDAGDYEQALDMFEKALQFRLEQGKEHEVRIARWCIARTLRSLGRVEEALRMQLELADQDEAAGDPDGYIHEELGEGLLLLGFTEEARPHFGRAYAILSKDPWLAENEPGRLARLKELGGLG